MSSSLPQPTLTDGLSLIGWRLKRDAEIRARKNDVNFECEVEPSSTSYAAFGSSSSSPDDLCLEVDAIDLNEYDPYDTFVRLNSDRTSDRYRYNFADDDTPIKYPLAIGYSTRRSQKLSSRIDDHEKDIAPTVMDIDDEYFPSKKRLKTSSTIDEQLISNFESENRIKLGELRVFAPKLRLRLSTVNVNWLKLPSIPNFSNKIHHYSS